MKVHLSRLFTLMPLLLFTAIAVADKGDTEAAAEGWARVDEGALLIDVRSEEEFEAGHASGAIHAPYNDAARLVASIGPDKNRAAVLYCGSGRRAGLAIDTLRQLGYTNLFNATGYEALEATRPTPDP